MQKVRAKMVCNAKGMKNDFYGHTCRLDPVYHNDDPNHENTKYWEATPAGSLQLETTVEMPFVVGEEYYVDISPVPKEIEEEGDEKV